MTDTETHCFHCNEVLGNKPICISISGQDQSFCCNGCASATQWILQHGLADYYTLRNQHASKVNEHLNDYCSWDRDDIQRGFVHKNEAGYSAVLLTDDMHCAACAWLIQKALQKISGVQSINANAITGRVELQWNPVQTKLSAICQQLAALGYTPYLSMNEAYEQQKRKERKQLLLKLGLAALVTTQTMMFSEALYLDTLKEMPIATRDFFRWLTFLLCSPVVFYSGSEFISGMLREIKHRQLGMDTLAASSILLAYFASLYQTLVGGEHIWFDAAAMFVFFLLSARVLERFARNKARAQVDLLAKAQPQFAWRITNGQREQCLVSELLLGDTLFLVPGEAIPADGLLLSESADVDESLLTGESKLLLKHKGNMLLAGSTLGPSACQIQVTEMGSNTQLSQILRLVQQAQNSKPIENMWAERLASRFVISMFAITLLAFAFWWQVNPSKAFSVALAVLVAACPCALSLAVPAAVSSAYDALARAGVLVLSADALTNLNKIQHVVFDKTGTLTDGHVSIKQMQGFAGESEPHILQIAYSMELGSKHPLASAFKPQQLEQLSFDCIQAISGQGIQAIHHGDEYKLGKAGFVAEDQPDNGIYLSRNQQLIGHFILEDSLKPFAIELLAVLQKNGLHSHLLSGDSNERVKEVAEALHIKHFKARATPEQKMQYLQTLQNDGVHVLMIGDGINDAPVLAQADVSMAMASGAYMAQANADILLMNSNLLQVKQVFSVAKHMRHLMRQNLQWAIAYNVIAVCIALSGLIHPGYASLGMAGSSLLVTLNALRIYRITS